MLINKKITSLIIGLIVLFGTAVPIKASVLAIQTLPSYINIRDFKLSCTSDASSVTFSVSKNGGASTDFASVNLTVDSCQIQVTSTQIDEETSYTFTVNDGTLSRSTTTIFDNSGPDPVGGFYKEGLSDGFKLHYHTPSNDDFSRVIIYRGDVQGFEADSSHEIATVTCSRDSDMTYEDHVGNTENRYYLIRAIDKAGNSSGLNGDGGGIITTVSQTTTPSTNGKVSILPAVGQGSVLGSEASPSPSPVVIEPTLANRITELGNKSPQPFKWILTHKKASFAIALLLIGIAFSLYRYSKKSN